MIFVSYRREDTRAEVTLLHRLLEERYGADSVFVDFDDIPPGARWPETLQRRLAASHVLLAVVGARWGDVRFDAGKNRGRLRLDDPEDWVRREISTALERPGQLVVVVLIDEAELPETAWNCALDGLATLQHARIRGQAAFEPDVTRLCEQLEASRPDLARAARAQRVAGAAPVASGPAVDGGAELGSYVTSEADRHARLMLPLVSSSGQPVVAPIEQLRIDLPLIVTHEHAPIAGTAPRPWVGQEVLAVNQELRERHTSALWVDRASRFDDVGREFVLDQLQPGKRLVIVGDPGCGKSTLLQWLAHHHGATFIAGLAAGGPASEPPSTVRWLPILVLCREIQEPTLPSRFDDLLRLHLQRRQFPDDAIARLVPHLQAQLAQGRALLLVDGLDEIAGARQRLEFCRLLGSLASRCPNAPIVVTSRVVGFQAVREELAPRFDHLLVGPLDRDAKSAFIQRWAALIGWDRSRAERLVHEVCHGRLTAKLTDNVFLLALVTQVNVFDGELPGRRVDVYRRAVQLMVERGRPWPGQPLTVNEVLPHIEFLAYRMRQRRVQRCTEQEALAAFVDLRRLEAGEAALHVRPPEELLEACALSLGLLNVAGSETDERGFDRPVMQFFHQSFQEYFAGQAIKHRRDGAGQGSITARLRAVLEKIDVREREIEIFAQYKIVEPLLADYWQEAVRMLIADLKPDEADDAILMLLPSADTKRREARPRAVFALQCLADEPQVSATTTGAVIDAALDNLHEADGFSSQRTWMDSAMAAVSESASGRRLGERLIEAFCQARGLRRRLVGSCAAQHATSGSGKVTPENASALVAVAVRGLASARQSERVSAALDVLNRCYLTDGKLGFLAADQRRDLVAALLASIESDEATQCAAVWALCWLTGARTRERGRQLEDSTSARPTDTLVLLNEQQSARLLSAMRQPGADSNTVALCALTLTRDARVECVGQQFDWIYEMARMADGVQARRNVPAYRPTHWPEATAWLKERLLEGHPDEFASPIGVALGALGVYLAEMVQPLARVLENRRFPDDIRDEALVYLALTGTREAAMILVAAADTPPVGEDDYLYVRGLFGLLLLDDVDLLAQQIRKALPHSDLNAYAFGLAGSRDERGRSLLAQLQRDGDPRVGAAAAKALATSALAPRA